MTRQLTPAQAWSELLEGNKRFVEGDVLHPSQGSAHRTELTAAQFPFAVLFGCSDSRVAAEIIFDQGLGDLFVVRTAGHVIDTTVVGSIEYGVDLLSCPLVVILAHDSCGAVAAATTALTTGQLPRGFVRAIVDRVIPSIVSMGGVAELQGVDPAILGREHVRNTMQMMLSYSAGLSEAVEQGSCAIVALEYTLANGAVRLVDWVGEIGDARPSA